MYAPGDGPPAPTSPTPTVGGSPHDLSAAGDAFRDGANALARIQNAFFDGGQTDIDALKNDGLGDRYDVGTTLAALAKLFFDRVWSGNIQLQDAALDLWDVAGAFKKADAGQVYANVVGGGLPADVKVFHGPNGETIYVEPGLGSTEDSYAYGHDNVVMVVDKEGKVLASNPSYKFGGPWIDHTPVDRPKPPAVPCPAPGQ